jgi:hypothetical protein
MKSAGGGGVRAGLIIVVRRLAAFPPFAAMLDNPIRQGVFETDVVTDLFGFDPFVAQNFFALRLEFAVERGFFNEIVAVRAPWLR